MGAATGQQIPRQPTQQPLAKGEFVGPGGVRLKTRGVSKEQMAALKTQLADASKGLEDYAPAATDPADQAKITGLIQSIRELDTSTPEGYAEGRRLASEAGLYAKYGRVASQNLTERKVKVKSDEEAAVHKGVKTDLADQNPLSITPALVRGLYANRNGKDYSYLIKDTPDEQLKLGDARLWDRLGQITGQLSSMVNVDKGTQSILLSERKRILKHLGMEDEPVPPMIGKRAPTPEEVAAEKRRVEGEKRAATAEQRAADAAARAAAEEARKAAKFPVEMAKLRADTDKLRREAAGKTGDLSKLEQGQLATLRGAESAARSEMDRQAKSMGVYMDEFNFDNPKRKEEVDFKPFVQDWRNKAAALKDFFAKRGAKVEVGGAAGKTAPAAAPAAPPRQRLSNPDRLKLIDILVSRGKSRADAEKIAGQYR
jgi:hypothetical protein